MNQQEAANGNQLAPTAPPANATPEELALWLADTRTRAHRMIDESVTAAQEMLIKRVSAADEGDATAQAQRHAQRLAIERLRRAIGDLTLEIRGVHGRLDRLETLIRAAVEAPTTLAQPRATAIASPPTARIEVPSAAPLATAIPARVDDDDDASEERVQPAVTRQVAEPVAERAEAPAAASMTTPEPTRAEASPAPTAGFAADARAAVEAAVASALQEARRAASLRPSTPRVDDEPVEAPRIEVRAERSAPSGDDLRTAMHTAAPIVETPRAEAPPSAPIAQREAQVAADEHPAQVVESAPAQPAGPAARPSLWVPPSAIAPRRTEPAPAPADSQPESQPAEAPRTTLAAASLPASAVPPAPAPMSAAATVAATSVATAPAPASVGSPFEGHPAAAAAAAAAVSRFAAATATATTERLAPGTFGPEGGPIVLRIAPISGFQGLMRVQDAVVQHPPVREATVEAYARGEARLRLQLASLLEAEELSSALTRSLGLQARVENVSDDERSIQVTLV